MGDVAGDVKTRVLFLMLFCLSGAAWSSVTVSTSDSIGLRRADTKFPVNRPTPRINDLLSRHRIRTNRRFRSNFQNDFCVARNDHFPLNSSGVIVAACDTVQPVMFLSASTARGPPWSADQSLYLFDNALDRPAPHFYATSPFSEFHLHDSSSVRNATRRFIHAFLASRVSASLVAVSFSIKCKPIVYLKELL